MKILTVDIGAGTQDILLYDSEKNIENCLKLVLPSPSKFFTSLIEEKVKLGKDLFIAGEQMGGGRLNSVLKRHLKAGYQVFMTPEAAYTLRNHLEEVEKMGIQIVEEPPPQFRGERVFLKEINFTSLKQFLKEFGEDLREVEMVGVAVQDHGVSPKDFSNRKFRLEKIKEILKRDSSLDGLAFLEKEIPPYYLRMKSAARAVKKEFPQAEVLLMDTAPAAILGCLQDLELKKREKKGLIVLNIGNDHTLAALLGEGRVLGILEHHTALLNPSKLQRYLTDFASGRLKEEEIFQQGGHGVFYLGNTSALPPFTEILTTGPNRELISKTKLRFHFPAPGGDMMITGCIGLVQAFQKKITWP